MDLFELTQPSSPKVLPILLSLPHSGTLFPGDLKGHFKTKFVEYPEDADWFLEKLYDFAPEMGITVIKANLSRYVVDLNRDPKGVPLYDDQRVITGTLPLQSFAGEKLYKEENYIPSDSEVEERLQSYYWPYYFQVQNLLEELKETHSRVLFFDGHSIKRQVPSVSPNPFPDLILGDNNQNTASPDIIKVALDSLRAGPFGVNHNEPFKGGHLTRYFGKPNHGVEGLQLEMSQELYMDEEKGLYDPEKAGILKPHLKKVFENFARFLEE